MSNEESDMSDGEQATGSDDAGEISRKCSLGSLPEKSKEQYQNTYRKFIEWRDANKLESFSEDVILQYFTELSDKVKPPTLWANFSMLKHTIIFHHKVNIGYSKKLRNFLKAKKVGYKSKQTKVFTSKDIERFLKEAPDNQYLPEKVALIFGIIGACKNSELIQMTIDDIDDDGVMAQVRIPRTESEQARTFMVHDEFYKIYKTYAVLRPKKTDYSRFFLNYRYGKCFNQAIGHNKFNYMPKTIATFLKLPNPDDYKGNSFRHTSASLLAHSGADSKTIQRHVRWNSKVARDVIAETKKQIQMSEKTDSSPLTPSTSGSGQDLGVISGVSRAVGEQFQGKVFDDLLFVDCHSSAKVKSGTGNVASGRKKVPPSWNVTSQSTADPKMTKITSRSNQEKSSSEIRLRWGHYHSNMETSFPSLLDSEDFVDVTLACEGRSLKCHKLILSSCSEYLAQLLRENVCSHPIIIMQDLKFWQVEALVKFMYRGEVDIPHEKLQLLLKAANALQIKGLINSNQLQTVNPTPDIEKSSPQTSTPSNAGFAPQLSKRESPTASRDSSSRLQMTQKRGEKRPTDLTEPSQIVRKVPRKQTETPALLHSSSPEIKSEIEDTSLADIEIFQPDHSECSPSNFENSMEMSEDLQDSEKMEMVDADFMDEEEEEEDYDYEIEDETAQDNEDESDDDWNPGDGT